MSKQLALPVGSMFEEVLDDVCVNGGYVIVAVEDDYEIDCDTGHPSSCKHMVGVRCSNGCGQCDLAMGC